MVVIFVQLSASTCVTFMVPASLPANQFFELVLFRFICSTRLRLNNFVAECGSCLFGRTATMRRAPWHRAAALASAAGVVAAVAMVSVGLFSQPKSVSLAQVQVSASGQLLPVGGKSLWDTALSSEPQRLKKLHQVHCHLYVKPEYV